MSSSEPLSDPGRLNGAQIAVLTTLATGATLGLRFALDPVLYGRPTLVLFALPILLSAYAGGLGSGLLATALSWLATSYFMMPPLGSFRVASAADRWQLLFLAVMGVAISVVCEGLHRARHRAASASRLLAAEKMRLEDAQAIAKLGSWETDLSTRTVTWSAETYRIFEKTPGAFEPKHQGFLESVHPDDRKVVDEAFTRSVGMPGAHSIEHRVLGASGGVKFVEERWQTFAAAGGRPARAVGTCQDVSARKEAAAALEDLSQRTAQRERMLTTTLSFITDFAYIYDRDGRFLFVNKPLLDLWGISLEEAVGRNFFDLGYPHDLAVELQRQVQQVFATGQSLRGETAYTSPAGVGGFYEYIFAPAIATDGSVEFVVGSTRDITDRKLLETRLLQAQKLEAVGRLAGGVAHDVNNTLGVILGHSERLLRTATGDQRPRLDQIVKATQRMAGLTRQLLVFSQRQPRDPKVVDLRVLVAGLQSALARQLGGGIALALVPGRDPSCVRVDPSQMEEAITHLCLNARDAMPGGGTVRIEIANVDLGASNVEGLEVAVPGTYVCTTVTDTGTGIDDRILPRIFDPFFTTKKVGQGPGLGLAIVHGIVQQAGGYVSVDSQAGGGAAFRIYLPHTGGASVAPGGGSRHVAAG